MHIENQIRISPDAVERHIKMLSESIGVRLAGSTGEKRAESYIAAELNDYGAQILIEEFPIQERAVEKETLLVELAGKWHSFSCSLLGNALGTDGKTIEVPIVFFSSQTDYQRKDLSFLTGKAVVHLGSHIEKSGNYKRLFDAKPAFVLFVDVRFPGTVATSDGMFPAYIHKHGAMTIASVAFLDAWRWRQEDASAAKLCVQGEMRRSSSSNIIAELPGSDPNSEILFVGAHHDTQANSVGADDNATGVAAMLAITQALAKLPRKRTIRLISFGAEEQLSVGSSFYVRQRRKELKERGGFMFNFDSFGSLMGWSELTCCGSKEMGDYLNRFFMDQDEYLAVKHEIVPYTDQFPFAAAGIPGVYLGRSNCTSGRFFHHRPDDTLARVSIPLCAKLIQAACLSINTLANVEVMPFQPTVPEESKEEIDKLWQEIFGGWEGFI
ncbi:MAG: M28 family metallopeptidase [Verrucomicrobia bacterium]|nr:M28 family metallopeptidase [Verrucomicrobiota bacterium]MDA1068904.1 M28 family metallopeptidase [Verrucomicrobiota bacterium]